jgi:tripartite-type tricarboxylate transporter receptor subunit TctC
MATARSPLAPDTPTFREQGFDIVLASLRGMAAPKGLPADVRSKLVTAFERAISEPKFQAEAAAAFAPLRYLAPDAYAAELREADVTFRKLWAASPWVDK